jgi:hypothetical protein
MRWLLPVLAKLSLLTKRIHGLPIAAQLVPLKKDRRGYHLRAAAARTYLLDMLLMIGPALLVRPID